MAVDDQANAQGRSNVGSWNSLLRRKVNRDGLTGADATVEGIPEDIDLRKSRKGHSNRIYLFIELIGGASSVTLELFVNGFDPVPLNKDGDANLTPLPAAADQWFLFSSLGTFTANAFVAVPAGASDVMAGRYKVNVSAITPGGGSVRILEAHTES